MLVEEVMFHDGVEPSGEAAPLHPAPQDLLCNSMSVLILGLRIKKAISNKEIRYGFVFDAYR